MDSEYFKKPNLWSLSSILLSSVLLALANPNFVQAENKFQNSTKPAEIIEIKPEMLDKISGSKIDFSPFKDTSFFPVLENGEGITNEKIMWSQDPVILFKDKNGKIAVLVSIANPRVVKESLEFLRGLNNPGGTVFGSLLLGKSFVGQPETWSNIMSNLAKEHGYEVKQTPLALDGGNVIPTKLNGKNVAIIGYNTLLLNHQILKNTNHLNPEELVKIQKETEFSEQYLKELEKIFSINRESALVAASELHLTKRLVASTLNLEFENIIYIKQVPFHIDLQMFAIGDGKVVLSDYTKSKEVSETYIRELCTIITAEAKKLNINIDFDSQKIITEMQDSFKEGKKFKLPKMPELSDEKRYRLLKVSVERLKGISWLYQNILEVLKRSQPLLDSASKELENKGFNVTRMAINFGEFATIGSYDVEISPVKRPGSSQLETSPVNHANGVLVTGKNNQKYFVTNGSGHPSLDLIFAKEFYEKMQVKAIFLPRATEILTNGGAVNCITLHK